MEAKAIKKPSQKNVINDVQNEPKLIPKGSHVGAKSIKKMMPKMSPNWFQRGSQNGAKIIKNEVLEAPCFKGGSQVASRAPPGSILERFGDHFGTIFVSFSDIVLRNQHCPSWLHSFEKQTFCEGSLLIVFK